MRQPRGSETRPAGCFLMGRNRSVTGPPAPGSPCPLARVCQDPALGVPFSGPVSSEILGSGSEPTYILEEDSMRLSKPLLLLFGLVLLVSPALMGPALACDHGCPKAAQASQDVAGQTEGKPCCARAASEAAIAAIKNAGEHTDSAEAKAAVQAAILAVDKANGEFGC